MELQRLSIQALRLVELARLLLLQGKLEGFFAEVGYGSLPVAAQPGPGRSRRSRPPT